MAKKISELPAAVSVADADEAPIVQGGVTKRAAASLFATNAFTGKTTTNLAEGVNLYYTAARFNTAFAAKSTTDLSEGANLYYTAARFNTAFSGKTTTDLAEGTNLYYTAARFNTAFAAKSTTDLTEGTNLYFTNARARLAISVAASPLSYDNSTGILSFIALTGDVTTSLAVATIAVGAVTDAKGSLAIKPASTVVATTNQALTGTPTIDGQATAVGSIILLTAQSAGAENGPWMAAAGAWSRPTWYPSGGTTQAFAFITTFIRLGTTYQGSTWRMTTTGAITIDTTATTWVVTPHALNSNTINGLLPIVNVTPGANNTTLQTNGSGVVVWAAPPSPYNVSTISANTSAVSGVTYLCDTSGGAFNLTLPTPIANAFIVIKDKSGTFNTNNLTVVRNAAEQIEGLSASKILQTNWGSWSFFSDGTNWFMGPF